MYFREGFTRSVPLCYQALTRLKLSLWDFDRSHRLLCGSDCRVTSILFIVLLLSSKLPHLARSEGLVAIQEAEERKWL
nr:MAG TPA: hypothetical protein [Caudoviricetes sp.]